MSLVYAQLLQTKKVYYELLKRLLEPKVCAAEPRDVLKTQAQKPSVQTSSLSPWKINFSALVQEKCGKSYYSKCDPVPCPPLQGMQEKEISVSWEVTPKHMDYTQCPFQLHICLASGWIWNILLLWRNFATWWLTELKKILEKVYFHIYIQRDGYKEAKHCFWIP